MPKERLLGKVTSKIKYNWIEKKTKILIGCAIAITKTVRQPNLPRNQLLLGPLIHNAT